MEKISEKIRQSLLDSGQSLRSIGQAADVDASQLSRFARGERTLSQAAIDAVAEALGLELRPVPKRRRGRPPAEGR